MERNVGTLDRTVRVALGVLLGAAGAVALAGYWELGLTGAVLALVGGAVMLVTGTTRRCPIYQGAGIDTVEGGE